VEITLTENAIKAVGRFISNSTAPITGLRILITGGGCSGFQYGMRLEEAMAVDDAVVDYGEFKVFVDPISVPLLEGVTIDFIDSLDGAGFKFNNPNASSSCACGQSFSA
jgi:iron-sulfur cluster assembly accessory protein